MDIVRAEFAADLAEFLLRRGCHDDVVSDIEKISGGDQREDAVVNRAKPSIVERRADEGFDRASDLVSPIYWLVVLATAWGRCQTRRIALLTSR